MIEKGLVYEDFADKVGHTFTLAEEGVPPILLTLIECELSKARYIPQNGRQPFTLLFAATTPQMLPQRLYQMAHKAMGMVTLFLVPIGKDERGFLHEAVFN